jgi:hypothetical protein
MLSMALVERSVLACPGQDVRIVQSRVELLVSEPVWHALGSQLSGQGRTS